MQSVEKRSERVTGGPPVSWIWKTLVKGSGFRLKFVSKITYPPFVYLLAAAFPVDHLNRVSHVLLSQSLHPT
jgi:hypothetical protein